MEKRSLIDKYDLILADCQRTVSSRKLKKLRNKRKNVSIYHDWILAKQVAAYTEGYYIAIGNAKFSQLNVRGNGKPKLRKGLVGRVVLHQVS